MPWGAAIGAAASLGSALAGGNSNTTTTQSGPPAWVQQNYQEAANLAKNVAGQPLRQYSGQMVAGFSPYQLEAMQGVQNAQNIANPYINAASQYASTAAKPIGVPGQLSNGQLGGLYSQGLGYSNQAAGTNIAGAGQPGVNAIQGGIGGINNALSMGSPQNYAGNVQQYMSPYTQNVVNSTQAEFNNQNAQQQQGVISNAVTSGAFGGDRASVAQGITAGQQALAQAPVIAGLENQGYTNAQNQLATQQGLGLQGSTSAGQLGASQASLGQSAAQQQAALQQQSAQQQLGLYSGQQQTGIGAQEASGWLGANAANIYGALGQQAQSSALTGASALYNMGSQQQNLEQEQLNIPYEQFAAQQAYPFQDAQFQINALEGIGSQSGGTSSTTGPSPSLVSQGVGGALAGAGLYNAINGTSSGGFNYSGSNYYNPSGNAGDTVGFARGGRLRRAAGGGMGMTNSPFGAFASPMASGMTFGQPPKAYAAGGVAGLSSDSIEDPSISIFPQAATAPTQQHTNIPQPPPPSSPYSASGNSPSDMSSLIQFAQLASSFNRGGTVPRGFAAAGGPQKIAPTTNDFNQTGIMQNGFPVTGVVGSQMGSRGIQHPILAAPQNVAAPSDAQYGLNMIANYTPPNPGSLKYSQTTYPVLHGQDGGPKTIQVTPVNSGGQWESPAQKASSANPNSFTGTPTNLQQVYEKYLGRQPDPSGQSYYANMPISQVIQSIEQSPEYLGDQSKSTGLASGGTPHGFRSHYDDGGGIVGQTGAMASGLPIAGGNPIAGGMYQSIARLPPEKLQELAVRLPPQSAQGQLVRRALQMSHVNPQAATMQSQQAAPQQQQAQPSPLPQQQPMMANGGRLHYAPGGDLPSPDDSAFGGVDGLPDDLKPVGLSANGRTIFDLAGGDQNLAGKGITTPVSGALASNSRAGGFTPTPAPTLPDVNGPPQDADLAGRAVNELSPTKGGQGEAPSFMQSPWMALAATGAGILASRDPHVGVAIGQGLETGLKFEGDQQKQQQENQWKNKDVDLRAQELSNSLAQHKETLGLQTKEAADREQAEQDRVNFEKQDLAQRAADNAENRALRLQGLDQGKYSSAQPGMGADPNDPTKQVAGAYVTNTKTGEVEFRPGVTLTAKPKSQAFILAPDAIDTEANAYNATGQLPSYGVGGSDAKIAIQNRAAELRKEQNISDQDFMSGKAAATAAKPALAAITRQATMADAFSDTAAKNGQLVLSLLDKGAGPSGVPVVDRWLQAGRKSVAGDPDVTALDQALKAYQTETAKVLSGAIGASGITDSARKEIEDTFGDYSTPAQIKAAISVMDQERQNRRSTYQDQIKMLNEHLSGNRNAQVPTASSFGTPAAPAAPVIPTGLPVGSHYSPSRQQWRDPAGKLYDASGKPVAQ